MTMQRYEATISHFTIRTPYLRTTFDKLIRLGSYEIESPQVYCWTFPMANYELVKALLNADIQMKPEPLMLAIANCPSLKDTVDGKADHKGQGFFQVIFKSADILTLRYIEAGEQKERDLPRAVVKRFYDIAIKDLPLNEVHKSREIAEKVILGYPLPRFQRDSGTPDANKFYGTRTAYFDYFYYPLKVLQGLGIVSHTRGKKVIRTGRWVDADVDMTSFIEKDITLWGRC